MKSFEINKLRFFLKIYYGKHDLFYIDRMQKEKYKSWIDNYNDKFKENVTRFYGEGDFECSLYIQILRNISE